MKIDRILQAKDSLAVRREGIIIQRLSSLMIGVILGVSPMCCQGATAQPAWNETTAGSLGETERLESSRLLGQARAFVRTEGNAGVRLKSQNGPGAPCKTAGFRHKQSRNRPLMAPSDQSQCTRHLAGEFQHHPKGLMHGPATRSMTLGGTDRADGEFQELQTV
jgi:hypothetical protein